VNGKIREVFIKQFSSASLYFRDTAIEIATNQIWNVQSLNLGRDKGFSLLQNRPDLLLEHTQSSIPWIPGFFPAEKAAGT
jgi:hypothetical protein